MATYIELRDLFGGSQDSDEFRNRVHVATAIAAEAILAGTPSIEEQKWAANVFASPASEGQKAFIAVVSKNNAATIANIVGASDTDIQIQVDSIVPSLVIAFNAL